MHKEERKHTQLKWEVMAIIAICTAITVIQYLHDHLIQAI